MSFPISPVSYTPWITLGQFAVPPMAPQALGSDISPSAMTRLSNGAMAHTQQMANQQTSRLTLLLPIAPQYAGARALLADALLGGSEQTKAFLNACTTQGMVITAHPTADQFQINVSGPAGREADMMSAAMQLLTAPVVDARNFAILKEDISKNLQNARTNPALPLAEASTKAIYGKDHPYSLTTTEIVADMQRQTPASVMQVLQTSLQYPEGTTLSLLSSQSQQAQQTTLENGIQQARWYPSPYRSGPLPATPPIAPLQGSRGPLLVPNDKLNRAFIMEAWRAPNNSDPDYPAFCLMLEMLKGFSSGFFKKLRTEKGLVYGVMQDYSQQKHGGSYEVLAREIEFNKMDSALDGMREVVDDLLNQPVSPARLQTAKETYLLHLNTVKQSSDGLAILNRSWLQNGVMPPHPDALKARIQSVSADDVRRVAQRFLNPASGYRVLTISAPRTVLDNWVASKTGLRSA